MSWNSVSDNFPGLLSISAGQSVGGAPSRCYFVTVAIFDRTGMFVESNPGV